MLTLIAAVVLAMQSPKDGATALKWETVELEGTALVVEMPMKPQKLTQPTDAGAPMIIYRCRVQGASLGVVIIAPQPPIAKGAEGTRFDREWRAHLKNNLSGELLDQRLLSLDGHPGREVTSKEKDARGKGIVTVRMRYLMIEQRFCVLMAFSAVDRELPLETERFLNSANIAGKRIKVTVPLTVTSPEEALRNFLAALMTRDENALRALALPLAETDFEWLTKGEVTPPGQVEAAEKHLRETPIKALRPGETFPAGPNRTGTVRDDEVGEDRAVLLPDDAPLPFRLRKLDGVWRVDAGPVVAGRKAADAAREKGGNGSKQDR